MKRIPLKDDADLRKQKNSDDYTREKIIKDFLMWFFIILISFIGIVFIYHCIVNQTFQNSVMDLVKQNISGIIFTMISIFGLSKYIKKN